VVSRVAHSPLSLWGPLEVPVALQADARSMTSLAQAQQAFQVWGGLTEHWVV